MNKPTLHSQIMNLPLTKRDEGFRSPDMWSGYKEGHRDARHDAAELAAKADATISDLLGSLQHLADEYENATGRYPNTARGAIDRATSTSLPAAELQP